MNIITKLGNFTLIDSSSFLISHNLDFNLDAQSFFSNNFSDTTLDKKIFHHLLKDVHLSLFFWDEKVSIKKVSLKTNKDDEIESEQILKYVNMGQSVTRVEHEDLKNANYFKYSLLVFENSKSERSFDAYSRPSESFEYFFIINKKISEVTLDDIKKGMDDKNFIVADSNKDINIYISLMTCSYKNFMIQYNGKTFCFFEKEMKDAKNLKVNNYFISLPSLVPSPFIRGDSYPFFALLPKPVLANNEIIFPKFDISGFEKSITIAAESFAIFFDFLFHNQKEIKHAKNYFGLLDKIKSNMSISEYKTATITLAFEKNKGLSFNELLSTKNKEKLVKYFNLLSKSGEFKGQFKESLMQSIQESYSLSFDKLILNSLINVSKNINNNYYKQNPVIINFYNDLINTYFPEFNKISFKKLLEKMPVINLGVSNFLMQNSSNLSVFGELKEAVNSLVSAAAFDPLLATKITKSIKDKASRLVHESIELNGI